MNYSEIEKLYSPSLWSNRPDVIRQHLEFAKIESAKAREQIPSKLNVPYGEREREKIDIYGTDLPDNSPIFIFIHGGYWQELNKETSAYVVESFYKNKIKSIIIGYTLCPNVTVQEIVEEIEKAMKKCIEYANSCGSKNIYLSGYSAGAQLIASLFSNMCSSLPEEDQLLFKAVILCCGVYDLTPLIDTYINKALNLTYEDAKKLSPLFQDVKPLKCMVYVVVGEFDSPAFKEQSKLYYEKIKRSSHTLHRVIEDVDHFSIVENYCFSNYELVQFVLDMEKNR